MRRSNLRMSAGELLDHAFILATKEQKTNLESMLKLGWKVSSMTSYPVPYHVQGVFGTEWTVIFAKHNDGAFAGLLPDGKLRRTTHGTRKVEYRFPWAGQPTR